MRQLVSFTVLLIGLMAAGAVQAQTSSQSELSLGTLPRRFLRDEAKIWTSPLRINQVNARAIAQYAIPIALVSGALVATDRKIVSPAPSDFVPPNWSVQASRLGAWYSLAGFTGSTYLIGRFTGHDRLRETGLLSMEAMGHAQAVTFALKQITNRMRPLEGNQHGEFWNGGNSFPSGHSSTAFAVATVFAYEYRDQIAVPVTAYSLATLIAVARVDARRHWTSDVVVGSVLGIVIGRLTYKWHHQPPEPGGVRSLASKLTPVVGSSGLGTTLAWEF